MAKRVLIAAATTGGALATPNGLSRTPPAGWMSWQTFRCATNCTAAPTACINEDLYRAQADALISTGLAAAGFSSVHLDDCIMAPERDRTTHELLADPVRFPSGFQALGTYFHERNLTFAMYTAESDTTCAGLPGSRGFEALDARTFAGWGADYLKADGCGDPTYYAQGYAAMGAALQATGRPIEFSCSWPAYLGSDETQKPFGAMVGDGCNLWRNYIDMGPTPGYVQGILEHFGNYSDVLGEWAGPGHWNDPDQLLLGSDAISDALAGSQLALYAILAAPLILGTDVRTMPPAHLALLTNTDVLTVARDPSGRAGRRLGGVTAANAPQQVWARTLSNGDVAVALYNAGPPPAHPWHTACDTNASNVTAGGFFRPKGAQPQSWCYAPGAQSASELDWYCCNDESCAGWWFDASTGAGCLLKDTDGGWEAGASLSGSAKLGFSPPSGAPAMISVAFADVGMWSGAAGGGGVRVFDLWARADLGVTAALSWNVTVPWQGTAFLRLSSVAPSTSSAAPADVH